MGFPVGIKAGREAVFVDTWKTGLQGCFRDGYTGRSPKNRPREPKIRNKIMLEPVVLTNLELSTFCCAIGKCGGTLRLLQAHVQQGSNTQPALEYVCSKRPDLHRFIAFPPRYTILKLTRPRWGFKVQVVQTGPHPSTVVQ